MKRHSNIWAKWHRLRDFRLRIENKISIQNNDSIIIIGWIIKLYNVKRKLHDHVSPHPPIHAMMNLLRKFAVRNMIMCPFYINLVSLPEWSYVFGESGVAWDGVNYSLDRTMRTHLLTTHSSGCNISGNLLSTLSLKSIMHISRVY